MPTPVGQSARNLFDVGAQLAIMSRHLPWPKVITCKGKERVKEEAKTSLAEEKFR